MNESDLEAACLEWLASLGWQVAQGSSVRERYSDVFLADRLQAPQREQGVGQLHLLALEPT